MAYPIPISELLQILTLKVKDLKHLGNQSTRLIKCFKLASASNQSSKSSEMLKSEFWKMRRVPHILALQNMGKG